MDDIPFFVKIDHLGIAVPSLEAAVPTWTTLFGKGPEHFEEVPDQRVRTAFFGVGESHFELLEPTSPDSPIAAFLDKRRGGIHHVCVQVTDLDAALAEYKRRGVRLIDQEPRLGAHGCRIAFVHPAATGGVLLELSQPLDEPHPLKRLLLALLLLPASGRSGADLPGQTADPGALGAPLPVMLAADMEGNPTELKQFVGKPLLLGLWASWCAPCKQELPILEELHRLWGPRGLQVVGLSVEADRQVVRRAAAAFGLSFTVLHDAEQVVEFTFLTTQIPATRLYDRAGRLVWRGRGVRGDDPELQAAIEQVLAK